MQADQQKPTIQRRSFIGWLAGALPVVIGAVSFKESRHSMDSNYVKAGDDFLVVDGWVLPSAYFK
ncbi:hypothetical protein [Comamonas faecalis]|uniref:hypothetical protein n=1 Tax=Comamonas faecalis TaxID=1387849 RepID=UPI0031E94CE6